MKECIVSRNEQVRKNLKKEMRQMLRDMQRGDADDDFSWLSCRVFCVATKAYMTLKGVETSHSAVDDLTLSDTEVPHLVQEIQAWLVQGEAAVSFSLYLLKGFLKCPPCVAPPSELRGQGSPLDVRQTEARLAFCLLCM